MKLLSVLALLSFLALFAACSPAPGSAASASKPKSEVDQLIEQVASRTLVAKDGSFFAIKPHPQDKSHFILVEFKEASLRWGDMAPNDTDRLNGMLNRGNMYLIYAHHRSFDTKKGEWTLWNPGNQQKGIGGAIVQGMLGANLSQWSIRATKYDDGWKLEPKVTYIENPDGVLRLMRLAGVAE